MESNNITTKGFFLKLTAVNFPPYTTLFKDGDGVIRVGGAFGKLHDELVKRLRISYVVVPPQSGGFGKVLTNKTVIGMAGMLLRGEADATFGPYSLSYERFRMVDYLPVISDDPVTILSSSGESKETVDFTTAVRRTSWMIWACYLLSIGISCFWCTVDDALQRAKRNNYKRKIDTKSSYLWEFIRVLLIQGSTHFMKRLKSIPKRILLVNFGFSMLFFQSYFGGKLSTHAIVDTRSNIDSLLELIEESEACLLLQKGTLPEVLIMEGEGNIYERIKARMRSCPLSSISAGDTQSDEIFRMILSGDYTLASARNSLLFTGLRMCTMYPSAKLHTANEPITIVETTIAVGKHMKPAIRNAITEVVRRIISSGLMLKWMSDEQGLPPPCFQSNSMSTKSVLTLGDLESLKNLFYVWMSGVLLSIATFFVEILRNFVQERRKRMRYNRPVRFYIESKEAHTPTKNAKPSKYRVIFY